MSGLRILLADDHEIFREGLATLLRLKPEVDFAVSVATLREVRDHVAHMHPDVLLVDLQLDRNVVSEIPVLAAHTRVLMVTAVEQADRLLAAVRAGARGVVSKGAAIETLMQAIRAVVHGGVWLGSALQQCLVSAIAEPSHGHLTVREREIVRLAALGMRNAEIAAELFISPVTVKTHLGSIQAKLGARNRVEVAAWAWQTGRMRGGP